MPTNENSLHEPTPLPDSVTGDRRTPEDVDAMYECLTDHRRRLLIERLSETTGPVAIEELVRHVAERGDGRTPGTPSDDGPGDVAIGLLHTHLPKMDEAGVLEVDHETKTVREGDRFCTAESLLEEI